MTVLFRATRVLHLPSGQFSRMLDLGGVGSANANTSLDVGKNNKVQAIALDFDLITRAISKQKKEEGRTQSGAQNHDAVSDRRQQQQVKRVMPNRGMLEDMANLFNVKLGGDDSDSYSQRTMNKENDDDLSRLTGISESPPSSVSNTNDTPSDESESDKNIPSNFNPSHSDIRSKYASKLRNKVEGGLAGVELAKSKKEEKLSQGDAAGNLIARSIAASTTVSKSGSKWMATTGAGTLCTFLSNRSMKIALMPQPGTKSAEEHSETKDAMEQLAKQLPQVKFSLLGLDKEDSANINEAGQILEYILNGMKAEPLSTIVVSDRDSILGSAKEIGMYTCRVRKKNEPRGNITTSYTVEDVKEVEDVVNELNGISYNAVFNQ